MPRAIRITAGAVTLDAALNDSKSAAAVAAALPIEAKAQTWGDEIYFDIGLALAGESPQEVVALGDLGYWPPGQAFGERRGSRGGRRPGLQAGPGGQPR